jgi:hypothetical protein
LPSLTHTKVRLCHPTSTSRSINRDFHALEDAIATPFMSLVIARRGRHVFNARQVADVCDAIVLIAFEGA